MSLDLCILASGSTGNVSVIRSAGGLILLDCGLSPRATERRLAIATDRGLHHIAAVCLTHLDRDHLSAPFVTWLSRRQLPVFCHEGKVHQLRNLAAKQTCTLNIQPFGEHAFEPINDLQIMPISLAHDAEGSHGFIFSAGDRRIGFATDLGRVPATWIDQCCEAGGLDVLAIESNYCPLLQIASNRPAFLKQRIMGGAGHLSNEQALAAVKQVLNRHESAGHALPATVALLHRSRDCNCPHRIREVFKADARLSSRLVLCEQDSPTGWLGRRATRVKQLLFAW